MPGINRISAQRGSLVTGNQRRRSRARSAGVLMAAGAMVATALVGAPAQAATLGTVGVAPQATSTMTAPTGSPVTPDAGWQSFETAGGVGGTSVNGPYTFWNSALTKVTVTDAYCHGDAFSVVDGRRQLGDTATVPEDLRNCSPRFYLSDIARADASMTDPTFSHGAFYLAPGFHSLNFVNKTIWNGTDPGSIAFFRLESTPLTFASCKAEGWKSFGTLFKTRLQCLAVVGVTKLPTTSTVGPVSFATSPFGTAARGLTPPTPDWHKWTGQIFHATTYATRRTTPITQADPGREVLTVTASVSLSGLFARRPAVTTVTLRMTPQPQITSLIGVGQYGSLGNAAWELVGDPVIDDASKETIWTFRSTAAITPGKTYDPIVISFDIGSPSAVTDAVYNFARPMTASASAAATGYSTGTGSGWYLP
ncbi:MAG: hypothetical protein L0H96_21750 [Humibacillus sp.]|nr:hypothetical protein [Humibacillus sp.]MDN5779521.1 hypothetical protein [Humibacillus sp.]